MTATHPSAQELGDFLLGKLDGSVDVDIEGHLAECDACRERAATVAADDTFTELLAAARPRLDSFRTSAPTPTLDGCATPPAFAPTLAWAGTPGADATGLAVPAPLVNHPKYRPIRRLGVGGMGTVWLAEHTVMNRTVAVKVIRPDLLARPGATGRFLREVRAAAKLHHPNIVTAFDAEPAGDSCLLVMEYVPGETLADQPLSMIEALRAVRDAARGLAHAHRHGLVHRDVKPHNLIRSEDGTTKVLDFGLAGVGAGEVLAANGDGLTGAGMVVGTPDYIAPEQIADPHTADARADIYGLGCTLYHLLAGRPPVPDGSIMEKLNAQRERPMDPIPGLPAAVAAVLTKMTAKDRHERYQSADEVVAALERCIRMVEPVRRKRRRVWAVAYSISFILFLVISTVVYKLERENQIIEIATDDPDIEVVMKRKGEIIRIIDHKSHQKWEYDALKNEIAQADTPEGLTLALPDKQAIVLKRDGKEVFTVKRVATAAGPAQTVPTRAANDADIERLVDPAKEKGNALPVALLERNGTAAFRFGKWLLVFDGVACDAKGSVIFGLSAFNYPLVGGRGEGKVEFGGGLKGPGPEIHQKWDGKANEIAVNNYRFRLEGKGTRLVFGDKTYDATEVVQTIIINRDGTTRLDPAPTASKLEGQWASLALAPVQTWVIFNSDRFMLRRTDKGRADMSRNIHTEIDGTVRFESPADATPRFRVVDDKGMTLALGIYRLEGDNLFLCLRKTAKADDYPTKFATDPATASELIILKKWPPVLSDHMLIQGKWQAVSGEHDGDIKFTADELKQLTMTFAGDSVTVTQPGASHKGTFTIDQTRTPKHITVTASEEEQFRGNLGIYSLEGETLKICMGDAKMGRPTEFKARIGDKLYVNAVFKRAPGQGNGVVAAINHQQIKEIDNGKPIRSRSPSILMSRISSIRRMARFTSTTLQLAPSAHCRI